MLYSLNVKVMEEGYKMSNKVRLLLVVYEFHIQQSYNFHLLIRLKYELICNLIRRITHFLFFF